MTPMIPPDGNQPADGPIDQRADVHGLGDEPAGRAHHLHGLDQEPVAEHRQPDRIVDQDDDQHRNDDRDTSRIRLILRIRSSRLVTSALLYCTSLTAIF